MIFLGAGASATSGYPLAADLRLLTSSESHFQRKLQAVPGIDYDPGKVGFAGMSDALKRLREQNRLAIALFRNGCFASLDEFCKLMAGRDKANEVLGMRRLTHLALSLHNPEVTFDQSDYYPFVQKLFQDDLRTLRRDITVMSFNYDVYLESLLIRAWESRNGEALSQLERNYLTGGFARTNDQSWLSAQAPRFRLLKLHGSLDPWPESDGRPQSLCGGTVQKLHGLIDRLCESGDVARPAYDPHIYFPWQNSADYQANAPEDRYHGMWKELIDPVWAFAEKEVAAAEKISFVGLSMNPLLDEGFGRLFKSIANVRAVVAGADPINPSREHFPDALEWFSPTHAAYRVTELIDRSRKAQGFNPVEDNGLFRVTTKSPDLSRIRVLPTFNDFIQEELGPIQ